MKKGKNKYIVRKNGKSAVFFGKIGTKFCAKNRIIKLFLKFIDFEKKFDIQESNKRERK